MSPFDPIPQPWLLSELLKPAVNPLTPPLPLPLHDPFRLAVDPLPLSDLFKPAINPLMTTPPLHNPFKLAVDPLPAPLPLCDLFKPAIDPLMTTLPLHNPFKLAVDPLPAPLPLSDLFKPAIDPLMTTLPLHDPFKLAVHPLPAPLPLSDLFKPAIDPLMTTLPLHEPFKLAVDPSERYPLLSDLLKTSFAPLPQTLQDINAPWSGDPYRLAAAEIPTPGLRLADISARPYETPIHLSFSAFDATKLEGFKPLSDVLKSPLQALRPVIDHLGTEPLTASYLETSRLTNLTTALVNDWANTVGPVDELAIKPLLRDFQHTSDSYARFLTSSQHGAIDAITLPVPARGYFTSADALVEIQQGPGFDLRLRRDRETTREELEEQSRSSLTPALMRLDPRLLKLWRGANLAASSSNPDKIRHALTSLRELFTQVIHRLAPDEKIRHWTSEARYYSNGRPTRECRLLFICSRVTTSHLAAFVQADVRSVLALSQVFQQGTHKVDMPMSQAQLRLVFLRVEGALTALIEIGLSAE